MSLVSTLSRLKSNIFGGPGNTGFSKPPPSKVQNIGMSPTAVLESDPLRFGTYQFPKDVFENQQLGHYMVFYVNQQNRQKYDYRSNKPNIDFTGISSSMLKAVATKEGTTGLRSDRNRFVTINGNCFFMFFYLFRDN